MLADMQAAHRKLIPRLPWSITTKLVDSIIEQASPSAFTIITWWTYGSKLGAIL